MFPLEHIELFSFWIKAEPDRKYPRGILVFSMSYFTSMYPEDNCGKLPAWYFPHPLLCRHSHILYQFARLSAINSRQVEEIWNNLSWKKLESSCKVRKYFWRREKNLFVISISICKIINLNMLGSSCKETKTVNLKIKLLKKM